MGRVQTPLQRLGGHPKDVSDLIRMTRPRQRLPDDSGIRQQPPGRVMPNAGLNNGRLAFLVSSTDVLDFVSQRASPLDLRQV